MKKSRMMSKFIFWCLEKLAILAIKYTKHPDDMFQMGSSVVVKGKRYPFVFESHNYVKESETGGK